MEGRARIFRRRVGDTKQITKKAELVGFSTFPSDNGTLVPINFSEIPFDVKRMFYVYGVSDADTPRGNHAHKTTQQLLICLNGNCEVICTTANGVAETFNLESPSTGLFIPEMIWDEISYMSKDTLLLVLSSTEYDRNDYIDDFDKFLSYDKEFEIAQIGVFRLASAMPISFENNLDAHSSNTWLNNESYRFANMTHDEFADEHSSLIEQVKKSCPRSILDYGGSLGFGYVALEKVLGHDALQGISYEVVEKTGVCKCGMDMHSHRPIKFTTEPASENYDLVYIRTALQYMDDWKSVLEDIVAMRPKSILLAHTSVGDFITFKAIQMYYGMPIPYWFICKDELMQLLYEHGYECVLDEEAGELPSYLYSNDFDENLRLRYQRNMEFSR